jgi:hypothetical protein
VVPRRATNGGEGEASEEGEAVVDLGQQIGREVLELELARGRGSCGGGGQLPLPLPLELAAASRTGHDCFDEDQE